MFLALRKPLLCRWFCALPVVATTFFLPAVLFAQTTPASVDFGSVALGSSSAAQTISFRYPFGLQGEFFQIGPQYQGSFFGTSVCTSATCSVPVTFSPAFPGLNQGTVGYTFVRFPNSFGPAVPVKGIGLGPEIAFSPGLITTEINRTLANGTLRTIGGFIYQYLGNRPPSFAVTDPASNRVVLLPNGVYYGAPDRSAGFAGDGTFTTAARFNNPTGLTLDLLGNTLVADTGNNRIRKIFSTGLALEPMIETVAGNGTVGGGGDGGLAINASLEAPSYMAVSSSGDIYVSDTVNSVVRVISGTTGIIRRFAGTYGPGGYFGDGGAATAALLNHPLGLALDANDNLYIADAGNNVIRKVSGGIVTTVAGQVGTIGAYTGDGGPALGATLNAPSALAVDAAGSLYISDTGNHVIRKVSGDSSHVITTIVGSGVAGYSGDNGAANQARLSAPGALAVDAVGRLSFVDTGNATLRQVTATPAIVTLPQTTPPSASTAEVTISNIGNQPLQLAAVSYSATVAPSQGGSCSTSSPLAAGQSCTLPISVTPATNFATSGTVTVLSNTLNRNPAQDPQGITQQPIAVSSESNGLYFVPVTPCRVVDTRLGAGPFGAPFLSGSTSRDFAIRSSSACPGLIPANADVQAYSLNVTVVPHGKLRWLTAYPANSTQPRVSTLNSYDGRTKANAAIIPASLADTNRAISVYASDDTDLILDLNGYYVPAQANRTALAYFPVSPCRVVDTRDPSFSANLGPPALPAGLSRNFPLLSGTCGLPAEAQAYSLNVTAIPATASISYLTAWPTGQAQPVVSTLNATTGTVTANAAIVRSGTSGNISVYSTGPANLVIDVSGYYAPPTSGGLALYTVPPCRAYDSRASSSGSVFLKELVDVRSSCSVPQVAQAFVLNATVIPASPVPYLTLWSDPPQGVLGFTPSESTLNAYDGAVTSNLAIVPNASGLVNAAFGSGNLPRSRTDLLLDFFGYFAP